MSKYNYIQSVLDSIPRVPNDPWSSPPPEYPFGRYGGYRKTASVYQEPGGLFSNPTFQSVAPTFASQRFTPQGNRRNNSIFNNAAAIEINRPNFPSILHGDISDRFGDESYLGHGEPRVLLDALTKAYQENQANNQKNIPLNRGIQEAYDALTRQGETGGLNSLYPYRDKHRSFLHGTDSIVKLLSERQFCTDGDRGGCSTLTEDIAPEGKRHFGHTVKYSQKYTGNKQKDRENQSNDIEQAINKLGEGYRDYLQNQRQNNALKPNPITSNNPFNINRNFNNNNTTPTPNTNYRYLNDVVQNYSPPNTHNIGITSPNTNQGVSSLIKNNGSSQHNWRGGIPDINVYSDSYDNDRFSGVSSLIKNNNSGSQYWGDNKPNMEISYDSYLDSVSPPPSILFGTDREAMELDELYRNSNIPDLPVGLRSPTRSYGRNPRKTSFHTRNLEDIPIHPPIFRNRELKPITNNIFGNTNNRTQYGYFTKKFNS